MSTSDKAQQKFLSAMLEVPTTMSKTTIESFINSFKFTVADVQEISQNAGRLTQTYVISGPMEKYVDLEKAVLKTLGFTLWPDYKCDRYEVRLGSLGPNLRNC